MTIQDINWTIKFTRFIKGHMLALDVVEYLINNNGEYIGSYYTFAEELRGDKKLASNVRNNCMWLKSHNIIYVESTKGRDDYSTVIYLNEDWKNQI
jgi:hypothetical protein